MAVLLVEPDKGQERITVGISHCDHGISVWDFCETCDRIHAQKLAHSGAVYPAIETAYGKTVDHGFNVRIF